VPAAGLLEVVKDFQRLSRDDLYRFPIPKDVTGMNIMKATLLRLEDYEKKYPDRFSDIIDFTKAMAYERLRDYERAVSYYRQAAALNGDLGRQAKKNLKALEAFQAVLQMPLPARDAFEYMKALDEKVADWNELAQKHPGTAYEYLARVEEEKIDRAKVAFVEINRHRLKDGNQMVILGYSQLVTKHRQSKNLYRYTLDFGDYYLKLAKEYVAQVDPEGLSFDLDTFDRLAKSALGLYTEVAQQDGTLEKIEAQGKIRSLQGLMQRIKRLNR
jgi:tetratricopeptide (TPR) repeat protein